MGAIPAVIAATSFVAANRRASEVSSSPEVAQMTSNICPTCNHVTETPAFDGEFLYMMFLVTTVFVFLKWLISKV